MREIENNLNNVQFKGIQKPQTGENVPSEPSANAAFEPHKQIDDLSMLPEASLGKSQVPQRTLKRQIEADMKTFEKKPNLVAEVDKAIENYAKTHTEEETLQYIETAINEFFPTAKN